MELAYTRFPQCDTSDPYTIGYDNACNTHNYMLNREPAHFKAWRLYVDALHYKEHISCADSYDTGMPPSTHAMRKGFWNVAVATHCPYMWIRCVGPYSIVMQCCK